MISNQYTITTTRQKVVTAALIQRTIYLHAIGNGVVYIGGADVTTANGMLTEKNAVPFEMILPAQNELWAITGSGTQDLRILRTSNDGN
jgi:hypothetical protein